MRRKLDALFNGNSINARGNGFGSRIGGQYAPLSVQIRRLDQTLCRSGNDFVGPLQIVVTVERLINGIRIKRLVRGIGNLRIECFRTAPGETRKERVVLVFGQRLRGIDGFVAGTDQKSDPRHNQRTLYQA